MNEKYENTLWDGRTGGAHPNYDVKKIQSFLYATQLKVFTISWNFENF